MKKNYYILKNHEKNMANITVEASFLIRNQTIQLEYKIEGEIAKYNFPQESQQKRVHELWRKSCFEFFFSIGDSDEYYEINISPTTEWNIYHFNSYREGMKEVTDISIPSINVHRGKESISLSFEVQFLAQEIVNKPFSYNLATILLNNSSLRYFFTIHRKDGDVDFHNKGKWETKN